MTMSIYELRVTGMTCASCAHHVEQALKAVPGVDKADVAYPESIARLEGKAPIALETLNRSLPGLRLEALDGGSAPGAFGGRFHSGESAGR